MQMWNKIGVKWNEIIKEIKQCISKMLIKWMQKHEWKVQNVQKMN